MSGNLPGSVMLGESPASNMLAERLSVEFKAAFEAIGHHELFRNCSLCQFWNEPETGKHGCGIYHTIPPVRVIVTGCDSFKANDEIPF